MDDEIQKPVKPSMDWLLTFADLVSLLITFFVLLYSMKVLDVQKWDELKGSFSGVFSIETPLFQTKPDQDDTVEKKDLTAADQLDYLQILLEKRFQKNEVLKQVTMKRDRKMDTLTISFPSGVLFASGGVELKEEGKQALLFLTEALLYLDNRIVVAGHTDPFPISGKKYPTNWELAMVRAINVLETLQEAGMETPLTAASYGPSRFDEIDPYIPAVERYERARRVDIVIHGSKDDELK